MLLGGDTPTKYIENTELRAEQRVMYTGNNNQLLPQRQLLKSLCVDSGTWPIAPGGVSVCRRDLVDHL